MTIVEEPELTMEGTIHPMPPRAAPTDEPRPMTGAERLEKWRQARRDAGLKEVRNLWVHPDDEAAVRAFVEAMATARLNKPAKRGRSG